MDAHALMQAVTSNMYWGKLSSVEDKWFTPRYDPQHVKSSTLWKFKES